MRVWDGAVRSAEQLYLDSFLGERTEIGSQRHPLRAAKCDMYLAKVRIAWYASLSIDVIAYSYVLAGNCGQGR